MFGRKKKNKKPANNIDEQMVNIQVIPEIFYGGNDPEIYSHHERESSKHGETSEREGAPESHAGGGLGSILKKKIMLLSVAVIAFLVIVAGISWFYLRDYAAMSRAKEQAASVAKEYATDLKVKEKPADKLSEQESQALAATSTLGKETEESAEADKEITGELPPSLSENFLSFPFVSRINSYDMDGDQLTDVEEEVYGTDSGSWDSDKDGYFDGQEVLNLYNPKNLSPKKLIDSGLVREYVSPSFQYRIYYPISWRIGLVDNAGRQVLFSAANGDYVEINVISKDSGQDWNGWFAKNAKEQKITDLLQFTNGFKIDGVKRKDDLVAYFIGGAQVYALIYHPMSADPVNYKRTMQMMTQSFRHGNLAEEIPEQAVLPKEYVSEDSALPGMVESVIGTDVEADGIEGE